MDFIIKKKSPIKIRFFQLNRLEEIENQLESLKVYKN